MFSLIITIISVALVAALALATLYYGGDAYESGHAKAEAAKLRNQGQQLVAAAEFYYLHKGQWPDSIDQMVDSGHLSTVPVAQRTAIQEALAGKAWVMPVARQPLFTFDEITPEVCSTVNQDSYGLKGILPKLQAGYMQQCFGPSKNDLLMVVGRGSLPDLVAAVNEGLLVPENVSSDPIPDSEDAGAWTVPPGGDVSGGAQGAEPEQGALSLSPSPVPFDSVATHFSDTREVTVTNNSGQALALDTPALTGDAAFSIRSTTCGPTLAAGASCSVAVSYSPTEVASDQAATLTVADGVFVSMSASSYNPVSLQSTTLPKAKLNKTYTPVSFSDFLNVSNEGTPDLGQVVWEVDGSLPSGMSFDEQTGTLAGTPTALTAQEGQDFTVVASYKNNQGQQVYTIRVGEAVLDVVQISPGKAYTTCAVTATGAVVCWGMGGAGTLGNGTNTDSLNPVEVSGLSSGVASISVGNAYACAVTTAGGLKCWGDNTYGKLGDGTTTARSTPVTVQGLSAGVASVSAGGSHTCAVTTAGAVKCWGYNGHGQVGDGTTESTRNAPVSVVGLSSGVVQIAAGHDHSCALLSTGGVKCWGNGNVGQLGAGSLSVSRTPVDVSGLTSGVARISEGGSRHTCALTTEGGLKCWGYNYNGQLGDGTTTNALIPFDVPGASSGISKVSVGSDNTCFLTTSGGVKCWGWNYFGMVGDSTTVDRLAPVDVVGLGFGVQSIATGAHFSCALLTGGEAKCWGYNPYGNLGDGTKVNRTAPVSVKE